MRRSVALTCLVLACLPLPASAWGKKDKPPPVAVQHIQVLEQKTDATQVLPGQYYTQLVAGIRGVNLPTGPGSGKNLFGKILSALGGKKESREIGVVLKVTSGGVALPEYPLASYKLTPDGRIVLTDTDAHHFPLQRLDGGQLVFDIGFRDARGVDYDLGAVGKSLVALLPGSALVSEMSKPAFQKLAETGSTVLGAVGSYDGSFARHYELAPAGEGTKKLRLQLNTADSTPFGEVTLELLATPTLLHNARSVFAASKDDLVWGGLESSTGLAFELGGVTRTYLEEARALPAYVELLRAGNIDTVRAYCNAANALLGAKHGLTPMDRTDLVLQSMKQAGYATTGKQVGWYPQCFDDIDRATLQQTRGLDPGLGAAGESGSDLTGAERWAFGCWMRASTAKDCQDHAPDPRRVLEAALAGRVETVVDTAFSDAPWAQEGTVAKADLIDGLKAVPSTFRCIQDGAMLVTVDATAKVFLFKGTHAGGKIATVSIRPASTAAQACND